jgi:hypothetical protein
MDDPAHNLAACLTKSRCATSNPAPSSLESPRAARMKFFLYGDNLNLTQLSRPGHSSSLATLGDTIKFCGGRHNVADWPVSLRPGERSGCSFNSPTRT